MGVDLANIREYLAVDPWTITDCTQHLTEIMRCQLLLPG